MKGIRIEKRRIQGEGGALRLLCLRPQEPREAATGVLWLHGGGYAMGGTYMVPYSRARALAQRFSAVVVAPAYRLSGEAPYPAALEDAYAALLYMKENAKALGIRSDQLVVGGESAGGGLTAALCMLARDRDEVNIAFQLPLYPMLDDRDTETSRDNRSPVWNTRRNHAAWRQYLSALPKGDIPPYAAPARQTDWRGLPPAYTFVGDTEPFYAETLTFIENLRKAGVEAEVDVYTAPFPGCFHSFDMLTPWRGVSKAAIAGFEAAFARMQARFFAPQQSPRVDKKDVKLL